MRTCRLFGFLWNSESYPCSGFCTLAHMNLFSTQLVLWVSSWMSSVFLHTLHWITYCIFKRDWQQSCVGPCSAAERSWTRKECRCCGMTAAASYFNRIIMTGGQNFTGPVSERRKIRWYILKGSRCMYIYENNYKKKPDGFIWAQHECLYVLFRPLIFPLPWSLRWDADL